MSNEAIWRKVGVSSTVVPSARRYHCAHVVNVNGIQQMVMFGGVQSGKKSVNDVWLFNFASKSWTELLLPASKPSPRFGHSSAIVNVPSPDKQETLQVLLIVGGCDGENRAVNDIWLFDLKQSVWTRIDVPSSFKPRYHSALIHIHGQQSESVLILGGQINQKEYCNDAWLLNIGDISMKQLPCNKPNLLKRAGQSIIKTSVENEFILYGGFSGDGGFDTFQDAHKIVVSQDDIEVVELLQISGVLPQTGRPLNLVQFLDSQQSGYNQYEIYSFGGYDGKSPNNELLKFNLKDLRWQPVQLWMEMDMASIAHSAGNNAMSKPIPRYGHSVVLYQGEDGKQSLIVFGGCGSSYLNDIVQIDLN
ncbi:hypothetical protein MP228_005365 [Amoeboaphelidium protococcarum]|nr:hypothetical protein MP228_005365 [Amoeboaphelidium protococcarum]